METKFTEGPWGCKRSETGPWAIFGQNGSWVATTCKKQFVAADLANARLIAAAPDLLAALGHACDWIHDAPHGDNCHVSNQYEGDPGAGCNCGKDSIQKYIINTIAKATGA